MTQIAARLAFSSLLLVPSAGWAADLTVAPGGAGGAFPSIAQAVAAASPGDHIFVAAGTYVERVLITKPLAIFADPGAVLQHPNVTQLSPKTLEVRDIGAGDEVVISGLRVVGSTGSLLSFVVIHTVGVENCAGSVVLHNVEVETRRFSALDVKNAEQVLLLDSYLYPNVGFVDECCLSPLVRAEDSTLFVTNSVLVGLPIAAPGSFPFATNTPALVASSARVVVQGSDLTGGSGGPSAGTATPGSPAIEAHNSEVELRHTVATGGAGGYIPPSIFLPQGSVGAGGTGLSLFSNTVALVDQDSSAVGGLSGDGLVQASPVLAVSGSSAQLWVIPYPRLDVLSPAGAGSIGQPVTLGLEGLPNDRHLLFLSSASAQQSTLPGVAGEFLLDSASLNYLGRVPLDGQGLGQWSAVVPLDPALVGLTAYFQTLNPVGAFPAFGNAVLVPITG